MFILSFPANRAGRVHVGRVRAILDIKHNLANTVDEQNQKSASNTHTHTQTKTATRGGLLAWFEARLRVRETRGSKKARPTALDGVVEVKLHHRVSTERHHGDAKTCGPDLPEKALHNLDGETDNRVGIAILLH